jgi:hypothetical protein
MAVSLSVVVAKDGAGATIVGGLQAQDKSGAGTGPFTLGHIMIDGLAGTNMAAVTAANAVKVDGSAVTQPVSLSSTTITGTVASTQSGTWTVQPGNTANTTAWKVDGSAVTQPVSIATAPVLVAGSAIIGKVGIDQTTNGTTNKVAADLRVAGTAVDLGVGTAGSATPRVAIDSSQITTTGTAGAPSSQVVSTQGVAGMTPVAASGYQVTCATDITRPADTTAYTANDAWSDSTSAPTSGGFTLTSAARASGGSGVITDIYFLSSAVPGTLLQGEMHIFDSAATAINDNAAWNLSDADAKLRLAIVPFTLVADANNSYYHAQNLNIGFTCVGTANLRYLVKVKNAYTPTSAEVFTVRAKIIQST